MKWDDEPTTDHRDHTLCSPPEIWKITLKIASTTLQVETISWHITVKSAQVLGFEGNTHFSRCRSWSDQTRPSMP